MSFNKKQINIAKLIDKIAYVYKSYFRSDIKYIDQLDKKNGFLALRIFLNSYAYQRQGAPDAYPKIAIQCISEFFEDGKNWHTPTKQEADLIWKNYKQIARIKYNLIRYNKNGIEEIRVNQKSNPMNENNGIIDIMATYKINNIAEYVKNCLINKETVNAYNLIKSVRGIGTKIAPFYLRDIAEKGIERGIIKGEDEIEDIYLLQPIDTWLKQIFIILFNKRKLKLQDKQKLIVELCKKSAISPISFNQGAWILGSQLAGNFKKLKKSLEDKKYLLKILDKNINDLKFKLKTMDELRFKLLN